MRKLKRGRKFGRETDQRRALMKSMASSFFVQGKIQTIEARAKELRPFVEKVITRAKDPCLANRRILRHLFSDHVTKKIIERAAACMSRPGGYTRITRMGKRVSDASAMAVLELVE